MLRGSPAWVRNVLTVLVGMSVVNAGNYGVNIVFGWYLTPAKLGDVVFTTTGLLVLSAGALAMQSTTARAWAASYATHDARVAAAVLRDARRLSLWAGIAVAVMLFALAPASSRFFQLSSSAPLWWLGALAPLHLLQGVQRGLLQGSERMGRFTRTFQAEMLVRLFGSWLVLALGFDLNGVCAALFASVVASLLMGGPNELVLRAEEAVGTVAARSNAIETQFRPMLISSLVAQFSVIMFTQADILIAKARISPEAAGAFSIVVLTSRIVSFIVQAISASLLPTIVKRTEKGERTDLLLAAALMAVVIVATPLLLISWLIPGMAIEALFGPRHTSAAPYLLAYVGATAIHGLSCIVTDYAFSRGLRTANYVSAAAGLVKIVVAVQFASNLESLVQLALLVSCALLVASCGTVFFALRGQLPVAAIPSVRAANGRPA